VPNTKKKPYRSSLLNNRHFRSVRSLTHPRKPSSCPAKSKRRSQSKIVSPMPMQRVDLASGDRAKERSPSTSAEETFNRNVLGGIGGFGALFRLDPAAFQESHPRQLRDVLVGTNLQRSPSSLGSITPWAPTSAVNQLASTDIAAGRHAPSSSRLLRHAAASTPKSHPSQSSPGYGREACRCNALAPLIGGGNRAVCPASTPTANTTLPAFIVGLCRPRKNDHRRRH